MHLLVGGTNRELPERLRKYRGFVAYMPNLGLPCPARGQTRARDLPILVLGKTSLRRKGMNHCSLRSSIDKCHHLLLILKPIHSVRSGEGKSCNPASLAQARA